jgi:hypothetical protein
MAMQMKSSNPNPGSSANTPSHIRRAIPKGNSRVKISLSQRLLISHLPRTITGGEHTWPKFVLRHLLSLDVPIIEDQSWQSDYCGCADILL